MQFRVFYVSLFHLNVSNFRSDYFAFTVDKLVTICFLLPHRTYYFILFTIHFSTTLSYTYSTHDMVK